MIPNTEQHYQAIANSMIEALPSKWVEAKFEAIFYPGHSRYEAEYVRPDGILRSFQPTSDGSRAFRTLRSEFQAAGKPLWGRACFELQPDGQFKMSWDYDDCDQDGNKIFDEDQELQRLKEREQRLSQ